ncbi:MAG: acetate--CoA ligase family protein [Betaproteobacteria bacterium]
MISALMNPLALLQAARADRRNVLSEPDAKSLLRSYEISVPRGATVLAATDPSLDDLAFPLAAKLVSRDVVHKSEVGGVRLGLRDRPSLERSIDDLTELARRLRIPFDGILVEEMAPEGVELVVGGTIDVRFGPILMLGIGGIFVEIFGDCVFAVCPITRTDAAEMIGALRGVAILRGARGRKHVDESLIVDALVKIGGKTGLLVALQREISEIDINPLIVSDDAAWACDARIVLAPATGNPGA